MSKRAWIAAIALGLIVLVGPAASLEVAKLKLVRNPEAASEKQAVAEAPDQQTTQEPPSAFDLPAAFQGIESAIRDLQTEESAAERTQTRKRDSDDLKAQEAMALWAFWMFIATAATVFLTAAALIAIIRTLHHTKRAADYAAKMVDEAKATTKAAEASVVQAQKTIDLTRLALIATDRAWLTVQTKLTKPLVFGDGEFKISAKLTVTNIGKSPATHVTPFLGLYPDSVEASRETHRLSKALRLSGSRWGIGRSLFPSEPYELEVHATGAIENFIAEIEASRQVGREADVPYAVDFLHPAVVSGVRYALPGDTGFRFTFVHYVLWHIDDSHPGWDGEDDSVDPEKLLLEPGFDTGIIT